MLVKNLIISLCILLLIAAGFVAGVTSNRNFYVVTWRDGDKVLDYTSYSIKQQCVKVINDIHKTQEGYLKSHPDEAANGNPFHAVCIP